MFNSQELKETAKDLRVLYVEDEEDTRVRIYEILKLFFAEVVVAADGRSALDIFLKDSFDLIVTDLTMPVMDGIEMLKRVYELVPSQHVIVTTAHNNSENLMSTINMQVDGFLLKPLEMNLMLKLLYRVSKDIVQEKQLLDSNNDENDSIGVDYVTDEPNFSVLQKDLSIEGKGVILIIVIDTFNKLSDMFGNKISQWLIRESNVILKSYAPEGSSFYSLRWNEYAIYFKDVVLEDIYSSLQSYYEDTRLVSLIDKDGSRFSISFSYGALEGDNSLLMDNFDSVANKIKEKNTPEDFSIYNLDNSEIDTIDHLVWLKETIKALKTASVEVDCQSMVEMSDGSVSGYEALARINTGNSRLEPALFLEPSSRAGILEEVTREVIKQTFSVLSNKDVLIFINIGEHWHDDLDSFLIKECENNGIKFENLILDIKSQISLPTDHKQIRWLLRMKKRGFSIAIEHFENNLINSRTLFLLQPDYIKVNLYEGISESYIKFVIEFTRNFNIKTIAMDIENEAMFEKAKQCGFEYAMGFYTGKPVRIDLIKI